MKKLILMSVFGLMAVAANASQGTVVHTSCGKKVMTVGPEFFENPDEFSDYLKELNMIYCGEENGAVPKVRY